MTVSPSEYIEFSQGKGYIRYQGLIRALQSLLLGPIFMRIVYLVEEVLGKGQKTQKYRVFHLVRERGWVDKKLSELAEQHLDPTILSDKMGHPALTEPKL